MRDVYEAFKTHAVLMLSRRLASTPWWRTSGLAGYYCAMALGGRPTRRLAEAFQDLRELKVDVAYPFLLELYRDYATSVYRAMTSAARCGCRGLCLPPRDLRHPDQLAQQDVRHVRPRRSRRTATWKASRPHFLLLPSYRRFPARRGVPARLSVRDLYNFRAVATGSAGSRTTAARSASFVDEYTIEHIMPQNDNLSERVEGRTLGPSGSDVHAAKLHTLGNLTLTGYNSEYSDRPFAEKRDMVGGFREPAPAQRWTWGGRALG